MPSRDANNSLSEALLANVEPTRAEPGCIDIHVFRALRDPATFFIHSAWKDEAEFDQHATLPHTTAMLARVDELIDHERQPVFRCTRLA